MFLFKDDPAADGALAFQLTSQTSCSHSQLTVDLPVNILQVHTALLIAIALHKDFFQWLECAQALLCLLTLLNGEQYTSEFFTSEKAVQPIDKQYMDTALTTESYANTVSIYDRANLP